jgi:hypothetical protein
VCLELAYTVNSVLVAIKIGTSLSFGNCCKLITEKILMFSNFVENTVEYYRNVLLLIILKRTLCPTNLHALV